MKQPIVNLIIPSYNAGKLWNRVLENIKIQSYPIAKKILIDSSSNDNTVVLAEKFGFEVTKISQNEFNHGLTRKLGVELTSSDCDLILFLTQDAVLTDKDAIKNLVKSFEIDSNIAIAYGRQLPNKKAAKVEKFMRSVNYPSESLLKTIDLKYELGIKTALCSNSFASYKKSKLLEVGCFTATNFGEDMLTAAKLLQNGNAVYYCAEAEVFHSHNNCLLTEFKRNYDIGRMHQNNQWLLEEFGSTKSEGKKLLVKAFKEFSLWTFVKFLIYCAVRYSGYLIGKRFFYKIFISKK